MNIWEEGISASPTNKVSRDGQVLSISVPKVLELEDGGKGVPISVLTGGQRQRCMSWSSQLHGTNCCKLS